MKAVPADHVVKTADIASLLTRLALEPARNSSPASAPGKIVIESEIKIAMEDNEIQTR